MQRVCGRLGSVEVEGPELSESAVGHVGDDVVGQLFAERAGLGEGIAAREDAEAGADDEIFDEAGLPGDADAGLKIAVMSWQCGPLDTGSCGSDDSIGGAHGIDVAVGIEVRCGAQVLVEGAGAEVGDVVLGGEDLREDLVA